MLWKRVTRGQLTFWKKTTLHTQQTVSNSCGFNLPRFCYFPLDHISRRIGFNKSAKKSLKRPPKPSFPVSLCKGKDQQLILIAFYSRWNFYVQTDQGEEGQFQNHSNNHHCLIPTRYDHSPIWRPIWPMKTTVYLVSTYFFRLATVIVH